MLKYPIGIQSFEQIREDGYVYVDKTDLVYRLLTTGKIYFLSRRCVVLVDEYDKPLPMIYQSGYLTIKDYDRSTTSFLLDFPNNEVKSGFVSLAASGFSK